MLKISASQFTIVATSHCIRMHMLHISTLYLSIAMQHTSVLRKSMNYDQPLKIPLKLRYIRLAKVVQKTSSPRLRDGA
jgi:hypothetical protein